MVHNDSSNNNKCDDTESSQLLFEEKEPEPEQEQEEGNDGNGDEKQSLMWSLLCLPALLVLFVVLMMTVTATSFFDGTISVGSNGNGNDSLLSSSCKTQGGPCHNGVYNCCAGYDCIKDEQGLFRSANFCNIGCPLCKGNCIGCINCPKCKTNASGESLVKDAQSLPYRWQYGTCTNCAECITNCWGCTSCPKCTGNCMECNNCPKCTHNCHGCLNDPTCTSFCHNNDAVCFSKYDCH